MSRLSTRAVASGVLAVYAGRARVGYLTPRDDDRLPWHHELILVSEQMRGHPQGHATTREAALEALETTLERWMDAAGMEWRR